MKKVIILLAKNGDIAMVANHYIKHHIQEEKPVWVVSAQYSPILTELYSDYFDIHALDINTNDPHPAVNYAAKTFFGCQIGLIQQNGADETLEATRKYRNYHEYQLAKLDELFAN